jgi:hypothetical protein
MQARQTKIHGNQFSKSYQMRILTALLPAGPLPQTFPGRFSCKNNGQTEKFTV